MSAITSSTAAQKTFEPEVVGPCDQKPITALVKASLPEEQYKQLKKEMRGQILKDQFHPTQGFTGMPWDSPTSALASREQLHQWYTPKKVARQMAETIGKELTERGITEDMLCEWLAGKKELECTTPSLTPAQLEEEVEMQVEVEIPALPSDDRVIPKEEFTSSLIDQGVISPMPASDKEKPDEIGSLIQDYLRRERKINRSKL